MHSSSLLSLFTAGLACFAPLAAAYTKPTTGPEGNDIYTPSLNELVPVGQPYSVTWKPTTKGTVSLVLLRGPGSNAVPLYAIVENHPNNGQYSWTPSTSLEPDTTRYGLQLIDDATGVFQYSTQFGISNPDYTNSSSSTSSSSASASASASASTSSSASISTTLVTSTTKSDKSSSSALTTSVVVSAPSASGSGVSAHVTAVVSPTKPMTVPASLMTSAVTSSVPVVTAPANASSTVAPQTNGAGSRVVGLGGIVVAAGMAILVL